MQPGSSQLKCDRKLLKLNIPASSMYVESTVSIYFIRVCSMPFFANNSYK